MILEQDRIAATVFVRDGDRMMVETVARADTLTMPEIGVEIPVDDLYGRVEPEEPTAKVGSGGRRDLRHVRWASSVSLIYESLNL